MEHAAVPGMTREETLEGWVDERLSSQNLLSGAG